MSVDQGWRLLQVLPLGLLVIGRDGAARLINEQAASLLGVNAAEVIGRHWRQWLNLSDAGTGASLRTLPPPGQPGDAGACGRQYRVSGPDGSRRVLEISRVARLPQWPASWAAVLWLRDCTLAHEQLRRLRHLSAQDHLTNLVNRREFEHRLSQALERARHDGSRHVLLFMDLDRFKQINDRFGHPAGDAVLKQVAETLRSTVRKRDTLGRLGGDEFGLLMEQCELDDGRHAAEQLRRRLQRRRFHWGEVHLRLGISVGLVPLDGHSTDLQTVWRQADAACYRAKQQLVGVV